MRRAVDSGVPGLSLGMVSDLRRLIPGADLILNADLRSFSRWRAGGIAAAVISVPDAEAVKSCLAYLADKPTPRLVIGDGSNILFDDAGFDGVLIKIGHRLSAVRIREHHVTAEAGVWVPHFVRRLGLAGLQGLEHAIGIPGTLGGLVAMNGGSRRLGVGDHIVRVRGCDARGQPFERDRAACHFRYRGSTLQDDGLIILEADFSFEAGDPVRLRAEMIGILSDRRRKFPKALPNCGSVFLSDPAMYDVVGPPGAAIEGVGLKGHRIGDAQISPMHANFIVNLGNARSADILALVHLTRNEVHLRTGFWMDAEVRHVAPDGRVLQAHVAAADRAT